MVILYGINVFKICLVSKKKGKIIKKSFRKSEEKQFPFFGNLYYNVKMGK